MGTVADKLNYLQGTKEAIKSALIEKGVSVADSDTFRSYADKIGDIETTEMEDSLVTRNFTSYTNDRVTDIGSGAFYGASKLTTVYFPKVKTVGAYAFTSSGLTRVTEAEFPNLINPYIGFRDSSITEVDLPKVTGNTGQFYGCKKLVRVNMPNATIVGSFNLCSALEDVNMPLITSVNINGFRGCKALEMLDFQGSPTIGAYSMIDNPLFKILILRGSEVATLSSTSAFSFASNQSPDLYIYVPRNLIDSYKSAQNWSTIADRIRALEDYTVDGTTTGAFDKSKI